MRSRRRRAKFEHPEDDSSDDGLEGRRGSRRKGAGLHEIDLHGCSLEAAIRRLGAGLARCRAAGRSPVLVVTGKGHGSVGGRAVLAPGIERWLKGAEAASLGVSTFGKVQGGGAFEVSIRRSRT